MHIAGMRERSTAGGGALDAIAAFRSMWHNVGGCSWMLLLSKSFNTCTVWHLAHPVDS